MGSAAVLEMPVEGRCESMVANPRGACHKSQGKAVSANTIRNKDGYITNAEGLTCDDVCHEKILCPACGHPFEKWPEGWDGHATGQANFCTGLRETENQKRKAEFKARFRHLFRPQRRQ